MKALAHSDTQELKFFLIERNATPTSSCPVFMARNYFNLCLSGDANTCIQTWYLQMFGMWLAHYVIFFARTLFRVAFVA